jgi:hypothetical protein
MQEGLPILTKFSSITISLSYAGSLSLLLLLEDLSLDQMGQTGRRSETSLTSRGV